MVTIEERADNFLLSQGLVRGACASQIAYGARCMYDGYIKGDADRKAIDISMFQSFLSERGLLYGKYTKASGDTGYKTLDELLEYFNKSMED